jgi:hypothetical protein
VISPSYFSTLDLPILAGRAFDRRDTRDGVPVCIVNEAFARGFHGRSPIGQRVALRPASSPQAKPVVREIVGVARQVKGRPDENKDFIQLYGVRHGSIRPSPSGRHSPSWGLATP